MKNKDKEYIQSRLKNIHTDPLSEPIINYTGEFRTMYYSNARKNLQTVIAERVMHSNQDLKDLDVLRKIRGLNNELQVLLNSERYV